MRGACPFCSAAFDLEAPSAALVCPTCRNEFEVFGVSRPQEAAVVAAPAFIPAPVAGGGEGIPTAPTAPACARHPGNAAVTACTRCGDFVCGVCATQVDGAMVCVPCFEHKRTQGELFSQQITFTLPRTSLYTGIVALVGGWCGLGVICGPIAIATGVMAIREIRRQPALKGRGNAIAGIILGSVGTLGNVGIYLFGILSTGK
ncbi:MAG: DUF4190 domain-containing protein [Planctomycetes bacterium]|nr:DUF4190 domain-containing protein [Planctomycetota bacterium]